MVFMHCGYLQKLSKAPNFVGTLWGRRFVTIEERVVAGGSIEPFFTYYKDMQSANKSVSAAGDSVRLADISHVSCLSLSGRLPLYLASASMNDRCLAELNKCAAFILEVETPKRPYFLRADTERELFIWCATLQRLAALPVSPAYKDQLPRLLPVVVEVRRLNNTIDPLIEAEAARDKAKEMGNSPVASPVKAPAKAPSAKALIPTPSRAPVLSEPVPAPAPVSALAPAPAAKALTSRPLPINTSVARAVETSAGAAAPVTTTTSAWGEGNARAAGGSGALATASGGGAAVARTAAQPPSKSEVTIELEGHDARESSAAVKGGRATAAAREKTLPVPLSVAPTQADIEFALKQSRAVKPGAENGGGALPPGATTISGGPQLPPRRRSVLDDDSSDEDSSAIGVNYAALAASRPSSGANASRAPSVLDDLLTAPATQQLVQAAAPAPSTAQIRDAAPLQRPRTAYGRAAMGGEAPEPLLQALQPSAPAPSAQTSKPTPIAAPPPMSGPTSGPGSWMSGASGFTVPPVTTAIPSATVSAVSRDSYTAAAAAPVASTVAAAASMKFLHDSWDDDDENDAHEDAPSPPAPQRTYVSGLPVDANFATASWDD